MTSEIPLNQVPNKRTLEYLPKRRNILGHVLSGLLILVLFSAFGSAQAQDVVQPDMPSAADLKQQLKGDMLAQPDSQWLADIEGESGVATAPADESATPLGTRLGFQSYRDGAWMIYYAAEDGNGQTPFVSVGSNARPKTHPWKSGFLYASGTSGQLDIYFTEVGVATQQLTNAAGNDVMPAWNQNGTRIVFVSDRDGQADLWVMNADGSGQAKLTNDGAVDLTPAWSPDGKKIAWVKVGGGGNALWIMNPDGSDARPLTPELPYLESPTWSPDSSRIAFSVDGDGDVWSEIWMINADGSGAHAVYDAATDLVDAIAGTWSNDGNWLLFTRIEYVVYGQQIYLKDTFIERVGLSGGGVQRLTSTGRDLYPDVRGVDTVPPVTWFGPLPEYSRTWTTTLRWGATDAMSGVASAHPSASNQPAGNYDTILAVNGLSYDDHVAVYEGIPGATQYFKVSGTDRAGNASQLPPSPQGSTTFYDGIYAGQITDSRGVPIPQRPVSFSNISWDNSISSIANFGDTETDPSGRFRAVLGSVTENARLDEPDPGAIPLGISWKEGMGRDDLPEITLVETSGANYIQDGSFEAGGAGWQLIGDATIPETSQIHHRGQKAVSLGTQECPSLVCFGPATALASGNESELVMDGEGAIHALLVSRKAGAQGVYYLTKSPQTGWSSTVQIAQGNAYVPALAVDGQGNLFGIWHTDANHIWFAVKSRNSGWTTPVDLGEGMYADIAVDTTGTVHIAYDRTIPCPIYCNIGLTYQQRTPQGAWQPPVVLDLQDDAGSFRASIGSAPDGTLHLAWIRRPATSGSNSYLAQGTKLMYRTRAQTGAWSDLEMLWSSRSTGSKNLRAEVGFDGNNRPTLYFTGSSEAWLYSKDANGNWARGDYSAIYSFADRASGPSGLTHHLAYLPDGNEYEQTGAYAEYQLTTHRGENLPAWRSDSIFSKGADGEPSMQILTDKSGQPIGFYNDLRDPNNPRLRELLPTSAFSTKEASLSQKVMVPDIPNPTLAFSYLLLAGMPTDQSSLSVTVRHGVTDTVVFSTTQATTNWTLGWVDLSPWIGQEIDVKFIQRQMAGEPFVHVYLDDITLSAWLTPVAESVTPGTLDPGVATPITVTGQNFLDGVTVRLTLGDQIVSRITFTRVDTHTLTVDLPGLGPGIYDLWVIGESGQRSVLVGALRVGLPIYLPLVAR